MSPSPDHNTLATRLADILLKLNVGEAFTRDELAAEFSVSERTIYRDLNRFAGIVDCVDGRYQLVPEYRGKLTAKDLETFAKIVSVDGLFPNAGHGFLAALLDTLSRSSFLVRGHRYEALKPNDPLFNQLGDTIRECRVCLLNYADKRRTLEPYRLINQHGIWYLAAAEEGRLKAFTFGRISHLTVTENTFKPNPKIHRQIDEDDDIWFNRDKTEVILNIAPPVAYYFQRRKLLPKQEIVKKLESGGLVVSTQISHPNQILPIVRYWIPNISVVEPASLRETLHQELRGYLA